MLQQASPNEAMKPTSRSWASWKRGLGLAGLKLADAVPLLAPILSVPFGEKYPPLTLSPEQQRQRLFATLAAWLFGAASRQLHRGLR